MKNEGFLISKITDAAAEAKKKAQQAAKGVVGFVKVTDRDLREAGVQLTPDRYRESVQEDN